MKDDSIFRTDDQEEINRLGKEIDALKEVLFCCGELAVVNWNDFTVGLVDRTLKGFTITKERYEEILREDS